MKTRKMLATVMACVLSISCLSFAASATSAEPEGFTFNGEAMSWVLCDESGNIVQTSNARVTYGSVDIKNGYTMFFHNSDGQDFSLAQGGRVKVACNFKTAVTCQIGHTPTGGTAIFDYDNASTGATRTPSVNINIDKTGTYHFWVTNTSTDTVTMTSASVTNS